MSELKIQYRSFKNNKYAIVYSDNNSIGTNPSWFGFDDESDVRDRDWSIGEDDCVLDVGAAHGSYTLTALACGAKKVFAWSPQTQDVDGTPDREFLAHSLQINNWTQKCDIYSTGLYNKSGWLNTVSQAIHNTKDTNSDDVIQVDTLDNWYDTVFLPNFNSKDFNRIWLKIDVEGAEVAVLQGATRLINNLEPIILVENHLFKDGNIERYTRNIILGTNKYNEISTSMHCAVSHSLYEPKTTSIIKSKSFNGHNYKFVCLKNPIDHASSFTFEDESNVRDRDWTIEKGDCVFDVGSSFGSYTLTALAAGAAYAFAWAPCQDIMSEKIGKERDFLVQSLKLNDWDNKCTVYETAFYDQVGWLDEHNNWKFSVEKPSSSAIMTQTADQWYNDQFLSKFNINSFPRYWLKLDVEGAEVKVLKHAQKMIKELRPIIQIENHISMDGEIANKVKDILLSMDYKEISTVEYFSVSHSKYIPK